MIGTNILGFFKPNSGDKKDTHIASRPQVKTLRTNSDVANRPSSPRRHHHHHHHHHHHKEKSSSPEGSHGERSSRSRSSTQNTKSSSSGPSSPVSASEYFHNYKGTRTTNCPSEDVAVIKIN